MANFYRDNPDMDFYLSHPLMQKIVALKEKDYSESALYDHAPLDFADAMDSYRKVLEIIGEISADTIAPRAESVDCEGPSLKDHRVQYAAGTQQNHDTLKQAGVYGMTLPRQYGGLNFPVVVNVMAGEMISRADAGFANIWGLQDCAESIREFASDALKDRYLPRIPAGDTCSMDLTEPDSGSDLQSVRLKATYNEAEDQWYLNGVKRFITNGDAQIKLVLARSEEGPRDGRGLSCFVCENRYDDTIRVRRIENKLGIKGSPTCELVFKDAPAYLVGQRKLGLIKYVMSLMNGARLGVAGQAVGLGEAAYREALKYAGERRQFGKAVMEFPAVAQMLALMKARIQACRSMLYETARCIDMYKNLPASDRASIKEYQRCADMYTPLLKFTAGEYANRIAYDALQIHGGSGFMKDYPVERYYRDARILSIYEGTSQMQIVAAVRGVSTGFYRQKMQEYQNEIVHPQWETLKKQLAAAAGLYADCVRRITETQNRTLLDFHARRLCEMAAGLLMSHLLIKDACRNAAMAVSARVFARRILAENEAHRSFINDFDAESLGDYGLN